ncbi:hypothetical protein AB0J80_35940 [Actinoplanes sp. NPDC049548]|uniref:hypothetical protein n=1 Tax=Actinoplanes sp. NPDC049548 TaxID=3155152 RepID=UPI00342B6C12
MTPEQTINIANDGVQGAGSHAAVMAAALALPPAVLRGVLDLNHVEFQGGERKTTLARRLANELQGNPTS